MVYVRNGRVIQAPSRGPWPFCLIPGFTVVLNFLSAIIVFFTSIVRPSAATDARKRPQPRSSRFYGGGGGGGGGPGAGGGGGGGSGGSGGAYGRGGGNGGNIGMSNSSPPFHSLFKFSFPFSNGLTFSFFFFVTAGMGSLPSSAASTCASCG